MGDLDEGEGVQECVAISLQIADSLCCTEETNSTGKQLYS